MLPARRQPAGNGSRRNCNRRPRQKSWTAARNRMTSSSSTATSSCRRGLVNRLMVRNHGFVPRPELGWKSGVLFEREQTRVLVVTADNGREIHMSARGPERKSLLSVIAADLDAVNGRFEGLKVEKWVPCCCTECATLRPEVVR